MISVSLNNFLCEFETHVRVLENTSQFVNGDEPPQI